MGYKFGWAHLGSPSLDWVYSFLIEACWILSSGMSTFSCSMWDLVPWPRIKPRPPALGAQSLSHWTTREVSLTGLSLSLWLTTRLTGWSRITSDGPALLFPNFSPCPASQTGLVHMGVVMFQEKGVLLWLIVRNDITSAAFYWSKQITRLAQFQEVEKEISSFDGNDSKITLQRRMKSNNSGHFCKKISTMVVFPSTTLCLFFLLMQEM